MCKPERLTFRISQDVKPHLQTQTNASIHRSTTLISQAMQASTERKMSTAEARQCTIPRNEPGGPRTHTCLRACGWMSFPIPLASNLALRRH
ncbi:hypothetical protein FA95DRAFT_294214 [Auriscalpium vulgare]|uniref:Uncharacterized protein n=1 Tax=Auriscalpium vulgare TaxID=40419 RepID=A0ACB8RJC5_9AGAM|nr:hypothetical protein FA95DRAFT_294214 [Auriscalpium vulgare]